MTCRNPALAGVLAATLAFLCAAAAAQTSTSASAPASRPARLDSYGDPLPAGAVGRLGTVRLRQTSPAFSVAFSPDNLTFATGHGDGSISLWDRATGRRVQRFTGHRRTVQCMVFADSGKTLVSGSLDQTLCWWDLRAGRQVRSVQATAPVMGMILTPDGRNVLAASGRMVLSYGVANGERADELRLDKAWGGSLVMLPQDERLILGGQDGNIHFWHMGTRKEVTVIPANVKGQAVVAASADGKMLAWGEGAGKVRVVETATGKDFYVLVGHAGAICCLAFSPDGRTLASRAGDNTTRIWDLAKGKELWQFASCGNLTNSLAFSPDGRYLVGARVDKTVDLWDMATGRNVFDWPGHTEQVYALAFSPDGKRLASGAVSSAGGVQMPRSICMWDAVAGRLLWRGPENYGAGARSIAWGPDGKTLATCGNEKRARLWDACDGNELAAMPEQKALVTCLAFAPDGNGVFFGRTDSMVGLWDTSANQADEWAKLERNYAYSMGLSPDGRTLAVGRSGSAEIWDVQARTKTLPIQGPVGVLWSLRFTAGGSALLGGGASAIGLWETGAGTPATLIRANQKTVWCADPSPDGRLIASAGGDGTVGLWEAATGEPIARLQGHQGSVNTVAFARDGRTFYSAGADTQILVWSLAELFDDGGARGEARGEGVPPLRVAGILPASAEGVSPSEESLRRCWAVLADGQAAQAYPAQRHLAAAGEPAVALIRERLKPPPPPDTARMRKLIADLDSDTFAVREQAMADLRKIGADARAFLQEASQSPSLEVRERASQLMEDLRNPPPLAPEMKQALRAIAVLEAVGSDSARAFLKTLADGAGQSLPSRHARAALARLATAKP